MQNQTKIIKWRKITFWLRFAPANDFNIIIYPSSSTCGADKSVERIYVHVYIAKSAVVYRKTILCSSNSEKKEEEEKRKK